MVLSSLSSLNDVLDQNSGMLFFHFFFKCLSDMFSETCLENALTRLGFLNVNCLMCFLV